MLARNFQYQRLCFGRQLKLKDQTHDYGTLNTIIIFTYACITLFALHKRKYLMFFIETMNFDKGRLVQYTCVPNKYSIFFKPLHA